MKLQGESDDTDAKAYLQQAIESLQDAQQALDYYTADGSTCAIFEETATISVLRRAHRVSADAHQGLGNLEMAVQCLQSWAAADPSFHTKISKEIQKLHERSLTA